jgi:hypothetical protein
VARPLLSILQRRIAAAQAFAEAEPDRRSLWQQIFYLQNSLKVYVGRKEALSDKAIWPRSRPRKTTCAPK